MTLSSYWRALAQINNIWDMGLKYVEKASQYAEQAATDPKLAAIFDKVATFLFQAGAHEQARIVAQQELSLFLKINDNAGIANAHHTLGIILQSQVSFIIVQLVKCNLISSTGTIERCTCAI